MTKLRSVAVAVGAAAALATTGFVATDSATAAQSHIRLIPFAGATSLTLNAGTAKVLTANGVSVTPVSQARVRNNAIGFPVTGGLVRPGAMTGFIRHSGGLQFAAGGKQLTIRDFRVNLATHRLYAYADEARASLPVLKLDLSKATVSTIKHRLAVNGVRTVLTVAAAQALNGYFKTKLFKGGLPVGRVAIDAKVIALKK